MPGPLDAARAMAPAITARAAQIEHARCIPPDLLDAMHDAQLFQLFVPRDLGGVELDPPRALDVIETVAAADGSAGWTVMIGATTGTLSGLVDHDVARKVFGAPRAVTGGSLAPTGTADAVDGGYRLRGRWSFISGSSHATWLVLGTIVHGDAFRGLLVPIADVDVVDTWHVSGLRGTASNDVVAEDVFVPEDHVVDLLAGAPRHPWALFARPPMTILAGCTAAVALGIARAALNEFTRLALEKRPYQSRGLLGDRSTVQADLAKAEAGVQAARALLHAATATAWEAQLRGEAGTMRERGLLRMAATHAVAASVAACDFAYTAGGGTALYDTSPLQRHFRDVHAVTQHILVAPPTWELAGKVLLDRPVDTPFFV